MWAGKAQQDGKYGNSMNSRLVWSAAHPNDRKVFVKFYRKEEERVGTRGDRDLTMGEYFDQLEKLANADPIKDGWYGVRGGYEMDAEDRIFIPPRTGIPSDKNNTMLRITNKRG